MQNYNFMDEISTLLINSDPPAVLTGVLTGSVFLWGQTPILSFLATSAI